MAPGPKRPLAIDWQAFFSQMSDIIQGLWIGAELSVMERLSISSFLANGHQYHLYVYEHVKNVPKNTVVFDAADVLPYSAVFQYQRYKSYAGFSNFFRYKLLLEKGGWWADTDIVCLRPFDFPDEYVFSSEMDQGVEVVTTGVLKAPPRSEVMAYAWSVCESKEPQLLAWGETGPGLLSQAVTKLRLEAYKKEHHVFCPLPYHDWRKLLEPGNGGRDQDPGTYSIHLWNEMWRREGVDKNASYDPDSTYELLKKEFLD
jgi:mannosyltransferase OCH1-like enzyme